MSRPQFDGLKASLWLGWHISPPIRDRERVEMLVESQGAIRGSQAFSESSLKREGDEPRLSVDS